MYINGKRNICSLLSYMFLHRELISEPKTSLIPSTKFSEIEGSKLQVT
jgi:hypothetical protein